MLTASQYSSYEEAVADHEWRVPERSMSVLYGDDGIRHRVKDSDPKVLVTNAADGHRVDPSLVEHVLILDDELLQSGEPEFDAVDTAADDPAQL